MHRPDVSGLPTTAFQPSRALLILYFGLLALFMVLARWNVFAMPFERDEGEYAYSAWILSQNLPPYENSFLQKPPLIIYVYLAAQWLGGHGVAMPRVFALLFSFATCVIAHLLLRRRGQTLAALVAPFFLAAMWTSREMTGYVANVEIFMLLPLVGLCAWYEAAPEAKRSWRGWLVGGVLASLVNLFKPLGAPVTLVLLGLALVAAYRQHRSFRRSVVHDLGAIALGSLATILVSTGYFLVRGGFREMVEYAFVYNLAYSGLGGQGSAFANFVRFARSALGFSWPLLGLAGLSLWVRPTGWRSRWLCLLVAVATVSAGASFGHYWLMTTPFLVLIASATLESLFQRAGRRGIRLVGLPITAALLITVMVWPAAGSWRYSPRDLSYYIYGLDPPFVEAPEVAARVQSLCGPGEPVFVVGSEPEIYYYSQRRSASPFVITYPFTGVPGYAAKYQSRAIEQLQARPPQVIVMSRFTDLLRAGYPDNLSRYIRSLVTEHYAFQGAFVRPLGSRAGAWRALPISRADYQNASLLVFVRDPSRG